MASDEIKIGDTLWCDMDFGRARWHSQVITGETKQSWLIGDERFSRSKINKNTLLEANGRGRGMGALKWYTVAQMDDEKFVRTNRHNIGHFVGALRDREKLEAIAKIVGYVIPEQEPPS